MSEQPAGVETPKPSLAVSPNRSRGYLSAWYGWLLVLLISLPVMCVSWLISFGGLRLRDEIGEWAWVLYGAGSVLWLWFAIRFFFPAIWAINRRVGYWRMEVDHLTPSDVRAVVKERLMVLKSDLKLLRGLFHARTR